MRYVIIVTKNGEWRMFGCILKYKISEVEESKRTMNQCSGDGGVDGYGLGKVEMVVMVVMEMEGVVSNVGWRRWREAENFITGKVCHVKLV